jgi:beta-lactam-binding protein with PASTA domain
MLHSNRNSESAGIKSAFIIESTSPALSLSLSTPYLPFLGNRFVLGPALSAANPAGATTGYAVILRRQSDCSLDMDFDEYPDATTPSAAMLTSLGGAQDYFHQLAGLTTTPDVFAKGCSYPILGQPSSSSVLLLGTTADGAVYGASPANAGIYITVVDTTANTIKSTLTLPNAGLFSAVDVNGDGILDIVADSTDPTTQHPATAVFLGNGDGTFKPGVYYDIQGDFTVDDVNGDGKPDIVVCAISGTIGTIATDITTLIGKGDGTFTQTTTSAPGIGCSSGGMVTGDFNGDGRKDLLVHATVLLGNGDGTFTVGSTLPVNASLFLDEIGNTAVGDVNNDGKLDVVVSQQGVVAVFYGKGDGTFTTGPRYAALPDLQQVSLTDIDGDGNLDIVLGTSTGGIYSAGGDANPFLYQILMGRGDGTFVDSVAYNQGQYGNGENTVSGPQIATADFNGDNEPDALVFTPANGNTVLSSSLAMLPGDGTGKLGAPVSSPVTITPTMLVTASINKDGKADVVLAGYIPNGSPELAVLLNQGNGTFAGELDYTLPSPVVSLVTGDFNGDGLTDVAVGVNPGAGNTGTSGVYVLLGQSNGTLTSPVKIDASLNPTGLVAADINGDGKSDLIVADQGAYSPQINGALHVYLGNANGAFTAAAALTTSATNYSVAALGDLNGDGKLDLIVAGGVPGATSGTVNVYTLLGNGDGTFKAPVALAPAGQDGVVTSIALADVNRDGLLDVAIGNATDFTEVLLGNGDGTLNDSILALGQQPLALAAVDLNGDGFPELLVGTVDVTGTGNLTVFRNANAWSVSSTTVAVPNVVGLTQTAATTAITGAGLVVGTVTQQASTTVASGSVMSESPAAGTSVASGSAVNLVVSSGPGTVAVPNVVGTTQAAASTAITVAGLVVGVVTQQASATAPLGTVISQSPAAGTSVALGSAVNLVVSSGPARIAVPNVVGLTQAAATTAITSTGLVVGTVTMQSSATVAAGLVINESPVAGTSVAKGSAVNLVVSSGPAPVAVPNVVGLTQATASTAITSAGLVVGTITVQSSATVAAGIVLTETPSAGTQATKGSAVNLVISSGPAKVTVPNVVGLKQAAASSAITGAGLVVGTVTTQSSASVPAGEVVSETPIAGTSVTKGSAVNLVVSSGPQPKLVKVPNVVGLKEAAAKTAIAEADLVVGRISLKSSMLIAAGEVIHERPSAGAEVEAGSKIHLVVVSSTALEGDYATLLGATETAAISPERFKTSLTEDLRRVADHWDNGRHHEALHELRQYQDEVRGAPDKDIEPSVAKKLQKLADKLQDDAIACPE